MFSIVYHLQDFSVYKRSVIFLSITCILFTQPSCKKLVDVSPPVTSITGASVYTTDANAIAVLTGIYGGMLSGGSLSAGLISMSLYPGLSADELSVYGTSNVNYSPYYTNNLSSSA